MVGSSFVGGDSMTVYEERADGTKHQESLLLLL